MRDASKKLMKELAKPMLRLAMALAAAVVFLLLMGRYANPFVDQVPPIEDLRTALRPPPGPTPSVVPPPAGFPSMKFPPSKIEVPNGQPQPIATKYGLTYTVPADWRNGSGAVGGWEDDAGTIAFYGQLSDYGYNHCAAENGSTLARAGATGRNGVDLDTAAHEEALKAERIFADKAGNKPTVELRGPFQLQVSGRPAVRYSAVVTNIPRDDWCDPQQADFDIVATSGYATAEVMLFMIQHDIGFPGSISDEQVDQIFDTLRAS